MTDTMNATQEIITTNNMTVNKKREDNSAEICLSTLMGVAAFAGIWGAASLLLAFFGG